MTLVGAMVCSDYCLLASDTEGGHLNGFKTEVTKQSHRNTPPVAWGIAGNPDPGRAFVGQMEHLDWTAVTTWEALRKLAQVHLQAANQAVEDDLRSMGKVFGYENFMAQALVVGMLENRPDVLELWWNTPASFAKDGYAFIGVGGLPAKLARAAFRHERGDRFEHNEPLLQTIMELAAHHVRGVAEPIRMVRVNAAGVTVLR